MFHLFLHEYRGTHHVLSLEICLVVAGHVEYLLLQVLLDIHLIYNSTIDLTRHQRGLLLMGNDLRLSHLNLGSVASVKDVQVPMHESG
jgi:hypothetical protein